MDLNTKLNEQEAFIAFRETYELINPPPDRPSKIQVSDAGLVYWIKIISVLAVLLLVAMRTAEQFYKASLLDSGNHYVALFSAVLSVIGIEGLMLALAINRAKRAKKVNYTWEIVGIVLTLAISFLAGIGQSLSIVDTLNQAVIGWLTISLAIALSVASIVAYIGGEIIGSQIAELESSYQTAMREYKQEIDEYDNGLIRSWNGSPERRLVRGDLVQQAKDVQYSVQNRVQSSVNIEQKLNKVKSAEESLARIWYETGSLPTVRELAEAHNISVGTANNALRSFKDRMGLE